MSPDRLPVVRLFVTCWAVFALHWAPFIVREHLPAISLAESGTLDVSRFLDLNEDVFKGPNGGAYINNNIGASLFGAVPLTLARPVLDGVRLWNRGRPRPVVRASLHSDLYEAAVEERLEWYYLATGFATVAGLMAVVSAWTVVALGRALRAGGLGRRDTLVVAFAYAFGTPIFFRTGYLNHNLLVAHLGLLGFLCLWDPRRGRLGTRQAALAGFLGGLAVLCDYSGLLTVAALGLYAMLRSRDDPGGRGWSTQAAYVLAALPGLAAMGAYQWWAFGGIARPAQEVMPAIAPTALGYRGLDWPSAELLWANFFDPRFGLFVAAPVLALGLAAPAFRHARHRVPDREMWVLLGFFGAFVAFCAANQYARLQFTTGFRYLVPVVPALLVLSLQVVACFPRWAKVSLLAVLIGQAWLTAITHEWIAPAIRDVLAGDVQLSWLRRMHELGLVERPSLVSALLVAVAGLATALAWRRELTCAS